MRVVLPLYPFWENELAVISATELDAWAARSPSADASTFLFGWLPRRLFEGAVERRVAMGLLYLSGYFGGVWLRGAIDRAQPGTSQLAGVVIPPTEDGFRSMLEVARTGIDASGSGGIALAYCGDQLGALAQSLGYNRGYYLEIVERPPAGLVVPESYLRADLFGAVPGFAPEVVAAHDAAIDQGRSVWSTGLSVQGFAQPDYETLLDVSLSFLEVLQSLAGSAARAVIEGDEEAACGAAIANAQMHVWLTAYTTGLLEGRDPPELPVLRPGHT